MNVAVLKSPITTYYSYANTSRIVIVAALRAGRMDATAESASASPSQMA